MFKLNKDELEYLLVLTGWISKVTSLTLGLMVVVGTVFGLWIKTIHLFIATTLALLTIFVIVANVIITNIFSRSTSRDELDLSKPNNRTVSKTPSVSLRQRRKKEYLDPNTGEFYDPNS